MKKENANLPIFDIHQAAFLNLHGIEPELLKQGTRVIFEFPGNQTVFKLLLKYNGNPAIPVLDFVSCLRRLRSMMLGMRGNL